MIYLPEATNSLPGENLQVVEARAGGDDTYIYLRLPAGCQVRISRLWRPGLEGICPNPYPTNSFLHMHQSFKGDVMMVMERTYQKICTHVHM